VSDPRSNLPRGQSRSQRLLCDFTSSPFWLSAPRVSLRAEWATYLGTPKRDKDYPWASTFMKFLREDKPPHAVYATPVAQFYAVSK
jgi:hypothetical protein